MIKPKTTRAEKAVLLMMACLGLAAQAVAGEDAPAAKPLWELSLAGYGLWGPAYPGSDQSSGNFLPLPFPMYRGKFLSVGEDSDKPIRGKVFRSDWLRLDLDMDLRFGSDSRDIDARRGMPDLEPMVELGPELELKFTDQPADHGNLFLALQARGAVSLDGLDPAWQGAAFSPELRYVRYFEGKARRLKLRATPTFASRDYMAYYYEVDPAFATADRPAYRARPGYLGTTLGASWQQPITDRLEVRAGLRVSFLEGAANEASPLFATHRTESVYLAFLYKFWASKRTTTVEEPF